MNSKKIRSIIFDCDGVLVDSELITNTVFCTMLNELGLSVDINFMFENFVGNSMAQCLELVEKLLGNKAPESFLKDFDERTAKALDSQLLPVEGVEEMLMNLKIPYCLASSGSHKKIRRSLKKTRLDKYFSNNIFSVEEVEKAKPFPDVFLYAAKRMNFDLDTSLVIEDSPKGILAAKSAGIDVFGFTKNMDKSQLIVSGADHTFSEMKNLIKEIELFRKVLVEK